MKQMNGPFENAQTSHRDIEKKQGKGASIALGLIYDVEHKRFHKVYKDLDSGRIRIECTCDEADQEASTSVSAT